MGNFGWWEVLELPDETITRFVLLVVGDVLLSCCDDFDVATAVTAIEYKAFAYIHASTDTHPITALNLGQ